MTKYRFKIVVVGDYAVGKTTLIINFTEKTFRGMYVPTVGVQFTKKILTIDNDEIELTIWDIAGQDKFAKVRQTFYEDAAGFIIVYDLTRKKTIDDIKMWYEDVIKNTEKIPCILIGNKSDLKIEREISPNDVNDLIEKEGLDIKIKFETSAKTGENVEEGFHSLVKLLIRK
ncbi:MAG: Rab family GTPase [Candidatus Helarchaeota archaeon]